MDVCSGQASLLPVLPRCESLCHMLLLSRPHHALLIFCCLSGISLMRKVRSPKGSGVEWIPEILPCVCQPGKDSSGQLALHSPGKLWGQDAQDLEGPRQHRGWKIILECYDSQSTLPRFRLALVLLSLCFLLFLPCEVRTFAHSCSAATHRCLPLISQGRSRNEPFLTQDRQYTSEFTRKWVETDAGDRNKYFVLEEDTGECRALNLDCLCQNSVEMYSLLKGS